MSLQQITSEWFLTERNNLVTGLVDCPICNKQVSLGTIDNHISRGCPPPPTTSRSTQAKGWNAIFSGTTSTNNNVSASNLKEDPELWTKRIRKPNWNLASEKELRGILGGYGVGVEGDKAVLSERLRLWISLFKWVQEGAV